MTGKDADFLTRCRARMARIDAMPKPIRELVHEYGLTMVRAFLDCGVTKPNQIRHLIAVVREEGGHYGNSQPTASPLHRLQQEQ